MKSFLPMFAGLAALALAVPGGAVEPGGSGAMCVDCIAVRVGPPAVIRGPFPDELDAPFTALRLADGTFRGFSANGATYAIEGRTLWDMAGPRRQVLDAGPPGSAADCGRWLTSAARQDGRIVGMVHQEANCDYAGGRTDKSMAVAVSSDDGLGWTDLGTVITGTEAPQAGRINGEGDCTMIDGHDGYFYAYCLRNTDWQTIVARAPADDPAHWRKYHEGSWNEPGLGGAATAIGFIGPGAFYFEPEGWVAAVTVDPWFGGVRLSLSADKVSFVDLEEPLLPIDGAEWDRPADTDLVAYGTILDPESGGNTVGSRFVLGYIHVPAGKGFESRYLVLREVSLTLADEPPAAQAGLALTRWSDPSRNAYVTATGPLTGDRTAYRRDAVVAYVLTRPPKGVATIGLAECSGGRPDNPDHLLAEDGECAALGYASERIAGWLYAAEQPGTVPVYRCRAEETQTHFASSAPDCEGLGTMLFTLGHGLAP